MQVIITPFQELAGLGFFYSIHVHVPGCGKAKGKAIYPTEVFSIVPMGEKTLDIIKPISDFHKFEKIKYLEL